MPYTTAAELLSQLTPIQVANLKLTKATWKSATDLGASPVSLLKLSRLGLVEVKARRVQSSNPRARVSSEPTERSYRLSGRGCIAVGQLKRAEASK